MLPLECEIDKNDDDTHRPLEEGEAVLAVPVVGLVPHPIVPGRHFEDDMTIVLVIDHDDENDDS